MGQKIHPIAVRLNENRSFDASWFHEKFVNTFKTEILVRNILESFFKSFSNLYLGRLFYQKSHKKTYLTVFLYKPPRRPPIQKRPTTKLLQRSTTKLLQRSTTKLLQRSTTYKTSSKFQSGTSLFSSRSVTRRTSHPKSAKKITKNYHASLSSFPLLKTVQFVFFKKQWKDLLILIGLLRNVRFKRTEVLQKRSKHKAFSYLENALSLLFNENIYIFPIISNQLQSSAHFLAQTIREIFKKNRRKKKIPSKLIRKSIQRNQAYGIRVECSGRLGGAEIARKIRFKKGQTSLNVFSKHMDFAQTTALTKYGIIGIKIWINQPVQIIKSK